MYTNTNACTSGSLGTLKVWIRNKKNRKNVSVMCLTCVSLAPHLRLTCVSLYNDLISPPKHSTTHLNSHLVYTDTHTCTSGSLVTPKGSIRNKSPRKKWVFCSICVYVLRLLVCFVFICLFCIWFFGLDLFLYFEFIYLLCFIFFLFYIYFFDLRLSVWFVFVCTFCICRGLGDWLIGWLVDWLGG